MAPAMMIEEQLRTLNRALKMYSGCNQAMIYARDELALLEEICRIIVETGGYRLAWIGYAWHDEGRQVRPVAQNGYTEGYLATANITWADTERGRGPVGRAIREGVPSCVQNIGDNPDFSPWRAEAERRGYASVAAFPLHGEGAVFGALNIYSAEPLAFDREEMTLLAELASDLAYGVLALRMRKENRKIHEELANTVIEERLQAHVLQQEVERRRLIEEDLRQRNEELSLAEEELRQQNEELQATEEELRQQLEENQQLAEALRNSARLLQEAQEVALLGYYVYDIVNGTWESSEILDRIFGIDHEFVRDVEGWLQIVAPGCRDEMGEYLSRLLRNGGRFDKEYGIVRMSDRAERWVSGLGELEYNSQGSPIRMIGTIQDVTEQRRAHEALRKSEEKFARAFDTIPTIVAISTFAEGRLIEVNQSFLDTFGYDRKAVIGKTAFELGIRENQEDRASILTLLEETGSVRCLPRMYRKKDGDTILGSYSAAVIEVNGQKCLIGMIDDITEQKMTQEALNESEERFRQLFAQNDDALLLLRLESFEVVDANPAALELFGLTLEELPGLTPWTIIDQHDFVTFTDMIPAEDQTQIFQLDRATALRNDGSSFTVTIRGKLLHLRNDCLMYCSIRDITEKMRLEEEVKTSQAKLIHANKMSSLGMLVSGIAHEINNPNHCISINASVLTNVWRDAVPVMERVRNQEGDFSMGGLWFTELLELAPQLFQGIEESSRRITAIINNMRDYVKPEKGGRQSVDINAIIGSASALLWHHIQKHTDNYRTELQEGLPPAGGSSQQLEQVVINLIMNALQSLPETSCGILVKTALEDDVIVVSVRDQGKGMSRNVLESLTKPFFTTRIDEGGTGLGLYISSSIMRDHDGHLTFESEPGRGTIATMRVPAVL